MLKIKRNFGILLIIAKRYLSDGPFKGNKHYEFCVRHIKTDLNNHSYIIKQTTAIPKEKNNLSPITYKDIPYIIRPQISYNSLLPSTKQSKLKVTNDTGNNFLEKNVFMQDVNTTVTYYSTKEHNPKISTYIHGEAEVKNLSSTSDNASCHASTSEYRDDIFLDNNNDNEYIKSNYQENYLYTTCSFHDDSITNDGNTFSLIKIKELLNEKLKYAAMSEFNMKNILSDDLVILNQKIPEKESLLFFKNNGLHVIESSHTHFKNEVKKYIKELELKERNRSAPERLNLIRFSKLYSLDSLFDDPDPHNSLYFSKNNISEYMSISGSCRNSNDTTLKVKNSIPLEQNTEKNWIEYEEDCNDCKEVNKDENGSHIGFSPKSGPPFTEKIPINRDKLIEENVVPNTSILNIINSIDKSAVIIQKDLYITDQIIQKIQKEEEEKNKEIDKNKVETSAKKGVLMYLGTPSIFKNGMVTLSLAGLSAGIHELSTDDKKEEINNSNDIKSDIVNEKSTKEKNKSLQQRYLSNNKNLDVFLTKTNGLNSNKHNNSSASLTLNSIDLDGKISLNMLYEPNKVVPVFSFLSKNESVEENAESNNGKRALDEVKLNNINNDNTNQNKLMNLPNESKSQDHQINYSTAANLHDNKQQTSTTIKLLENKSYQQRTITDKNSSIPAKNIYVDDCNRISPSEGLPLNIDKHVNHSSVVSQNHQQPKTKKNPTEQTESKSMERLYEHNANKLNHSTLNPQDESYKYLLISKDQIQKIENELSKLKKLQSKREISSETLSDVKKLLDTFIKDNHLKKETSVSESMNESQKINSNPPKENADHIAELIAQSVKGSLENWLKENFAKKDTAIFSDIKHESEKPYAETPLEKSSNIMQNIAATGETLNDCFSNAETSISNVNCSDRGTLMDSDVNLTKAVINSEDNYYQPSNNTNSLPEVMDYDFLNQEEITYESEKNNSEISEEEPIHLLPKKEISNINYPPDDHDQFFNPNITETILKDKNLLQTKNKIVDTEFSKNNIQESNNNFQNTSKDNVNPPQFYSFQFPNETRDKTMLDKDSTETSRSPTKEGSIKKNMAKSIFDTNSSEKDSDIEFAFENNTDPDLSINKSKELLMMKNGNLNPPELSSISDSSGKGSVKGRKNVENLNQFFSTKKKLDSSNKNDSPVNHIRKTTISAVEQNNFTDINVSEIQTYVDSRLPIPFSTETFFQIFGSNNSLRDHSSYIDVAKYKLSSTNKFTNKQIDQSVLAKLEDIHRSVQHLNVLTINKNLLESKDDTFKNKALIPSKEVSKESFDSHVKSSKKESIQYIESETPKEIIEPTINKQNVSNFLPKFSLKIFKNNNLAVKAHNLKQMNKLNFDNKINISEIKKQDHKTPSKSEKSLLVMEPKNDNSKEIKIEPQKKGIQEPALTGIKVSRGKYVDLFSFNKNEKNKQKVQGHKKGIYDHRGLSKRDRKILREITKEIPTKKSKGKSNRKRPIRPITSRKTGNEIVKPMTSLVRKSKNPGSKLTLLKKDRESVDKTVLPNTHLSNKQKLLPPGKNEPEKKEVQKTFNFKIENTPKNVIPSVVKKSVENKNLSMLEGRKQQDIKIDKTVETIKISEAKLNKAEKFNVLKLRHLKHFRYPENFSIKKPQPRNVNNDLGNVDKTSKKPFCQTYVATEAYINQPEKIHQVPEKIFASKQISKKNHTLQKVTILENDKTNKENYHDTVKIPEGFKEELIRKSQKKIENRTNIDFRARMPKLRNTKQKLTFKGVQPKGKIGPAIETTAKKEKQKHDIKNKHLAPKKHLKNKLDRLTPKEIRTSTLASRNNKSNQSGPQNKETFSQPKPKTTEVMNNKPLDRMAKATEKQQEKEQLKIATTDKSKAPSESKTEIMIGQSESINKKYFPTFLIDVDKMSKEIKPELDFKNCQRCQVAHEKITDFPLHNQKKKLLFKPPFKILNLGPNNDPMLRNELKFFPSVTKVMNSTIPESSREILREWRKSMIDELGENGFKSFYKGQLVNGNKFNWQLHNFLIGGEQYKQDADNLSLKSIENVLRKTSDLSAINSHVIHRKLAYRGVIDCVAKYQNKPVLIEWKRLENSRVEIANSSIDVAATQLSAYVGALNHDETYKFQISGGLLVLAFNDGSEAEVIEINNEQCTKHWKLWLKRLQSYHEVSRRKTK